MNKNMIRPAFESKRTEEERLGDKRELITLSLNDKEKERIQAVRVSLQQEKDSTLLKQLALIGSAFVRNENPQELLAYYVRENVRRNKRWGLLEVEQK